MTRAKDKVLPREIEGNCTLGEVDPSALARKLNAVAQQFLLLDVISSLGD